jgi:tetratricopeptide (TPR) repeat protein
MKPPPSPAESWEAVADNLPSDADAYLRALGALMDEGELAVADAGFRAAMTSFPANVVIAARYARVAERRGDWAEAVLRWQAVRARHPNNRLAQQALATAMVRAGEADAADAMLAEVLAPLAGGDLAATDPAVRRLMMDHARLATNRGDLGAAHLRWQDLLRQMPDDPAVQHGWRELQTLAEPMAAPREADVAAPEPDGAESSPFGALMSRFESLGGTCEFGLVQRHFGVEPLGLFRWVSLSAGNLCIALEDRLAGIGEPKFTRMRVSEAREFSTTDTRYGLGMHTFIKDAGQDREKLLTQLQRRMRFLRDKLLEDLAAGEKIFLYRCRRDTSADEIVPVAKAVQAYNPANIVLAVKMSTPEEPAHAVRPLAPGVLCGSIRDGRKQPLRTGWAVDFESWLETCQQAVGILDSLQGK